MKKLFLALFIPIAVILGTPALAATLMYDGTGDEHMPTYLYGPDKDNAETLLFTELDTSIQEVEDGTSDDLVFNLHSDIINRAIYDAVLENNPDYNPGEDCMTDEECYVFADYVPVEGYDFSYRLVGLWVSFYDGDTSSDPGRFVFNAFLEIDLNGQMTYKTVVEVHFLFEDDPDYYYLEFDKVQLGRLPLPKSFFTSIINMLESQADIDLESNLDEIPLGELDLNNLSFTIQKDEILESMATDDNGEVDSGALLGQEVLSIIFENQLINFDLQDDEFVLTAGVSKFRSTDDSGFPEYVYDLHDQEEVGTETVIGEFNPELFDPEAYMQDLFTEYIFNSSFLDGGFKIKEKTFNKLIYYNADGFSDTRQTVEIPINETETENIELGLKAIWFEFEATEIYVKAQFRIAGIDSLVVIRAEQISSTSEELHFRFVDITAGKDVDENSGDYLEILDLSAFKQVFAEMGDVEFGQFNEDGDLIISAAGLSALLGEGTNEGAVEVTGIALEENAIVLTVTAGQYQATLDAFTDALEDVVGSEELITDLGGVLDTNDPTEGAVLSAVEDLQDTISTGGTVTGEQIEDLFTNFEDLDSETQEEFLDTIVDLIDPSVLTGFEGIFGALGEDDIPTE
ncbi:hypothetical protein [Candidatus Xianfuyuplasma coldseepsis]|uniref:Uncharacterized protein n=1 Tax=Candidatus Xianfuyuplasma coldseepsis TaxID=2782163 RepID=A0A7L7KQ18_9MOLU|nr:hypothetical protein [Xianfuyuplasma coldseepsis]QMS84890.1 hypothetical protein G4Z02_03685 [Xianfuyuplasma coldseepsis]